MDDILIEDRRYATYTALRLRMQHGISLSDPLNIYELIASCEIILQCKQLHRTDGQSTHSSKPRIDLSTLRPIRRRRYTAAHELGHHLLGHLSSNHGKSEELQADAFAGALLMPLPALVKAFATRGVNYIRPDFLSHVYAATWLGVSIEALHNQLRSTVRNYSPTPSEYQRYRAANKTASELLGAEITGELFALDESWGDLNLTVETNSTILLDGACDASVDQAPYAESEYGSLFRFIQAPSTLNVHWRSGCTTRTLIVPAGEATDYMSRSEEE